MEQKLEEARPLCEKREGGGVGGGGAEQGTGRARGTG